MTMAFSKMPRRFWSYTAGKGSLYAEEREAAREQRLQKMRENLPGFAALGIVMLLMLVMLLMMFAEFRGFYLDQVGALLHINK
jgi:hypothetical protein